MLLFKRNKTNQTGKEEEADDKRQQSLFIRAILFTALLMHPQDSSLEYPKVQDNQSTFMKK